MPHRLIQAFVTAILVLLTWPVATAENWISLETNGTPSTRHEAAGVAVDGKLYLLGGRRIQPADIFDPATKHWTRGAEGPIEFHHCQAVAVDGSIYMVGAMNGPDRKSVV